MQTIVFYFLQVILCSALMMAYYGIALRNKRFHGYNRFYLLSVAVLPWFIPLIKIEISKPAAEEILPVQMFSIIADSNARFEEAFVQPGFQFSWEAAASLLYLTVSCILFIAFLIALLKIYRLLKTNSCKTFNDVYLVLTQAEGTPFSFFKFIFWNTAIDAATPTGKQILQHELTHVKEGHSTDKIVMQLVIIAGWFNPIFWLVKRELNMVHEFIADNKAVADGDTSALANMLLTAAYPKQQFALTNTFFYSPIKRRLTMLTNNKHPRFSYVRRLLVLPLVATVIVLVAFRKKEDKPVTISLATAVEKVAGSIAGFTEKPVVTNETPTTVPKSVKLIKSYTVVIDAGHGGQDGGADVDGIDGKTFEKDINLSIAKLVKQSNKNTNINIVLTRETDIYQHPTEKVAFAKEKQPDMLITLHCNSAARIKTGNTFKENPASGIEIILSKDSNYTQQNTALINNLATSLKPVEKNISMKKRQIGVWIIDHNNFPSTLIEMGYITNSNDLKNLKDRAYQQQLANGILGGIENYFGNAENKTITAVKEIQAIRPWRVMNNMQDTGKTYTSINTADTSLKAQLAKTILIIDGKRVQYSDFEKIQPNQIAAITILKGQKAIDKYGDDAKEGVIEITLKNTSVNILMNSINNYFQRLKTGGKEQPGC